MKFTVEDLSACWPHHAEYLVDILNEEYTVEDAIKDLKSLIGSKFDKRVAAPK